MRRYTGSAPLICFLIFTACGSQYEAQSQSDPLAYKQSYCDMEASCIPRCMCDQGECFCDSEARVQECKADFPEWVGGYISQGEACKKSLAAWLSCITRASCPDVEIFFDGHPDGLQAGDPCASEYFNMECTDFEPPTEYNYDPAMIFRKLEGFEFALKTYKEIDFEDLPFDASSCGMPSPGGPISNPLDIDGVVFTDPACLQTGFCSSPTCQPDPDNPDGGNNGMGLNPGATIDFPDGTEGFLVDVQGMGDNQYGLKVTYSTGGSIDIDGRAVPYGVSYLGMLSMNGISRVEVIATGPSSNCSHTLCGPMALAAVFYGSR